MCMSVVCVYECAMCSKYIGGGGGGGSKQQHHVRWGPSEESEEDLSSSNPYIKTSPEFDAVISQVSGSKS